MKVFNLSSGSKGNVTLVDCGGFKILIDVGTTRKYLIEALDSISYSMNDIDMVLMTHFHSDHDKALKYFSKEIIFSYLEEHKTLELDKENDYFGISITPFELSHDNRCWGYTIRYNNEVYTHISDTGYLKNAYHQYIKDATILYLEFNHDIDLLKKSNRPAFNKKRILSDLGHLNNVDASYALCVAKGNLKELLVAHISEEANSVDKITKTIHEVFNDNNELIDFEIKFCQHHGIIKGGNHES